MRRRCKVGLSGLLAAALTACNPDAGQPAEPADAEAQYQLALRYVTGAGVAPDEAAALRWMRQAAEQGHVGAQYQLGSYYTLPDSRDDQQAVQWLRRAAEQGQAAAQYSPGDTVRHRAGGAP